MALGSMPIIPMNRIQPDPEARFQRFGANASRLYGKPMVDLVAPKVQTAPSQPTMAPRHDPAQTAVPSAPEGRRGAGIGQAPSPLEASPGYSGQAGNPAGTGIVPQPGAYLNTKA